MNKNHPGRLCARLFAGAFAALSGVGVMAQQPSTQPWAEIGRPATTTEIKAWDIDVRADFKGLPVGKGSAEKGMDVWEAKCASCHGTFGESNEVFTPIVGGTTQQDIKTGRVANLARTDFPQRTSMMKLSQLSTLWDYINRAMPWNEPKSLTVEEVYAVTAYILSLAEVVPDDFVLSNENIAEVQKRLPNRDGKVEFKGMWLVSGKPDVQGDACMTNCGSEPKITSILPDFARNAHGNLAEQTRDFGPFRGADTTRPALTGTVDKAREVTLARAPVAPAQPAASAKSPAALAKDANCLACHAVEQKLVGPSFADIAKRYKDDKAALDLLSGRVRNGAQGTWGPVPMPGNSTLADAEIRSVVTWIMQGGK
jgi:cytochrome c551/c552